MPCLEAFHNVWRCFFFLVYHDSGRCTGQPLQQRITWPKMSIVPRLRNPGLVIPSLSMGY